VARKAKSGVRSSVSAGRITDAGFFDHRTIPQSAPAVGLALAQPP
jgi:hypothetical protein